MTMNPPAAERMIEWLRSVLLYDMTEFLEMLKDEPKQK